MTSFQSKFHQKTFYFSSMKFWLNLLKDFVLERKKFNWNRTKLWLRFRVDDSWSVTAIFISIYGENFIGQFLTFPIDDLDSMLTRQFSIGKRNWTWIWLGFDLDFESKINGLMTHFQEWDLGVEFWSKWGWYVCSSCDRFSVKRPCISKQFFIFSMKSTSFRRRFRVETEYIRSVVLHCHS